MCVPVLINAILHKGKIISIHSGKIAVYLKFFDNIFVKFNAAELDCANLMKRGTLRKLFKFH